MSYNGKRLYKIRRHYILEIPNKKYIVTIRDNNKLLKPYIVFPTLRQSDGSLDCVRSIQLGMIFIQKTEYPNEHPLNVLPNGVFTYSNTSNKVRNHSFRPYGF